MKTFLPLLYFIFVTSATSAQSFSNLGFEYGVYKGQPRKWMIEGEAQKYSAQLDSRVAKQGQKSLFVEVIDGSVYTYLAIPGKILAGKNIHAEGYVKFAEGDSLNIMLAFRDPLARPVTSPVVTGEAGRWIKMALDLNIPPEYPSDRFLIAVVAIGTGQFWIDDFLINIDGKAYGNDPPDFREPTPGEIKMLNENAVDLDLLQNEEAVVSLFGSAKIAALGENSHGSASIYRYKLRLVKMLVEKKGFSVFALECPETRARAINDYVLYGKGDRQQVIENVVYPSWQTQEIFDIIEWIRKHNETSLNKVQFIGIDVDKQGEGVDRDKSMAHNIDSILQESNDIKMIVSADNTHISKSSAKMGSYLKKIYGEDYLSVGFTFQSGQYSAYGKEKVYPVYPPHSGTYEYFFSKSRVKNFILDLHKVSALPVLQMPSGFRSIGSRPQDVTQFQEIDLSAHFDAIVTIEKSLPTTPISK